MNEPIDKMLDDLETCESELTDWEREFVDSLRHQLARKGGLSPRQEEVLESIWEKRT